MSEKHFKQLLHFKISLIYISNMNRMRLTSNWIT